MLKQQQVEGEKTLREATGAKQSRILEEDMLKQIRFLRWLGVVAALLTGALGFWLYYDIKTQLPSHLRMIQYSNEPLYALGYLIVRSLALATVVTTLLVFGGQVARMSFDQSTRFAKRRLGAMFLDILYARHPPQDHRIKISEYMEAFDAWNQSIHSAFSHDESAKDAKRKEKDLAKASVETLTAPVLTAALAAFATRAIAAPAKEEKEREKEDGEVK